MLVIIIVTVGIPYLLSGATLWAMLFAHTDTRTRQLALIPVTLFWFPFAVFMLISEKLKA